MSPKKPPIRVTGPPRFGPDLPHAADQLWRRLYVRGVDDDLEKLHGYRPGGYHPVHLQDELHGGQYRVIHKLGHGGYATVWLCRDQHVVTPSYVAVKILVGSQTENKSRELLLAADLQRQSIDKVPFGQRLCLPLGQFMSHSPNGTHICLVFPVLGPVIRDAVDIFDGEESAMHIAQEVSRQAVGALAALHSRGICHGDLRPSNILLELQGLDGLSEEQVMSLLGEPEITDVHVRKDSHPTPEIPYAPKYLVYPPDFSNVNPSAISSRSRLIDFGQSFDTSQQPPPAAFGIPANYAAPEVVIDSLGNTAMDLWSLGCTLYEVRLGRRLFDVFQLAGLRKEDYVDEIACLLGEPPEPWAEYYESDDSSDTCTSPSNPASPENEDIYVEPQVQHARSIQEKLASCHDCAGEKCAHPRFQLISEAEAATLADLLEKLLRYRPEERLGAQDVLKHAWFHTQYR
ncbi:kinase [Hirsutella rhossiliensis]